MKNALKLIWYYIETRYAKLLRMLGVKRNTSVIPKGVYCYVLDDRRNEKEPLKNGYWVKRCKYYRFTQKTGGIACTYIGYYGFDPCLYDECKMCGQNEEINESELVST